MEGIAALRELLEPDDFMAKIDLKDAYTVVPIADDSRQYLTFQNRGIVYRYRGLPFGGSLSLVGVYCVSHQFRKYSWCYSHA
jgi:hypothetical protein